jgi:hypothetical protein
MEPMTIERAAAGQTLAPFRPFDLLVAGRQI